MPAQLDWSYIALRPARALSRLVGYVLFEGRPYTARGRWINPLVRLHLRLLGCLPCLKAVKQPVFIVGMGRSGSTILGKLLSLHPDVGFLNEPKMIWHRLIPAGDVVGNYSCDKACYRVSGKAVTPGIIRLAQKLFGAFLFLSRSRILLDKYGELIYRTDCIRALFPEARFVFLVRHAKEVCRSVEQWNLQHETRIKAGRVNWWGVNDRKWKLIQEELVPADGRLAEQAGTIGGYSKDADRAAVEWILSAREGLALRKISPDQVCLVHYEELLKDPTATLDRLTAFMGVPPDTKMNGYASKIVKPRSGEQPPVDLPEALAPLVDECLKELGYPHD